MLVLDARAKISSTFHHAFIFQKFKFKPIPTHDFYSRFPKPKLLSLKMKISPTLHSLLCPSCSLEMRNPTYHHLSARNESQSVELQNRAYFITGAGGNKPWSKGQVTFYIVPETADVDRKRVKEILAAGWVRT